MTYLRIAWLAFTLCLALHCTAWGQGYISGVSIPANSMGVCYPLIDNVWSVQTPPYPLNVTLGIGHIINPSTTLSSFAMHDVGYIAPSIPDPARSVVTFTFDAAVTVNQVEVIQHCDGPTKIEGFAGSSIQSLTSVGDVFGPMGDVSGNCALPTGASHVFTFPTPLSGTVFRFIIRKTSSAGGYALHRAFPRDASGVRFSPAVSPPLPPGQPIHWPSSAGGNDHYYLPVTAGQGITWSAASASAVVAGGHLATISNASENAFVFALVNSPQHWVQSGPQSIGPWFGGLQAPGSSEPAGGWQWVIAAEPFSFTNWNTGEPNNGCFGNESHLHFIGPAPSGAPSDKWNDLSEGASCVNLPISYVVEFDTQPSGCVPGISCIPSSTASGTVLNGEATDVQFGEANGSAGDINSDGFDDFLVGSAGYSPSGIGLGGRVDIISGEWVTRLRYGGTPLTQRVLHSFYGTNPNAPLCRASESPGDINSDGHLDFVISTRAPGGFPPPGASGYVQVINGAFFAGVSPTLVLCQKSSPIVGDEYGVAVSCGGDVNGDGYTDVAIGVGGGQSSGRVEVYSGAALSSPGGCGVQPLYTLVGSAGPTGFGQAVRIVADVSGDGFDDILVGASNEPYLGMVSVGGVYVFSGATGAQIWHANGAQPGAKFGVSVASAGTYDSDGINDFVVGSGGTASAVVFAGGYPPGGVGTLIATFLGPTGSTFGTVVSNAGDVDSDGHSDILVGSSHSSADGFAKLFSGADGSLISSIAGGTSGSLFGAAFAIGDVNQDGMADVALGAPLDDSNGLSDNGSLTIVFGPGLTDGQANSAEARLELNAIGVGVAGGPFAFDAPAGSTLSLKWAGPPNQSLFLATAPLSSNNIHLGCSGWLDIGTPPLFADLELLASGELPGLLNSLFYLGGQGAAQQTFTMPFAPGSHFTVQGAVRQPQVGPCGGSVVLTAAFRCAIF